ncbi:MULTISPECIES: MFS transporter [Aliiglaciecola]|uniref:MFS transporter n=1 Tax=Aliiglaciecola TaxID=1406885 RepID=UPI001C082F09|nr:MULTISPECIES: MFS transporter [Aliiglaciecola]MBU2876820.1 MFS transporter [Aliiglaciecola lipolytica]MDO6711923.1 MFS transporter [Aliiglaciecola sp. 2_MG-2023]MDO6753103.1 MFS transporter [Aliiglaciecola sp. 1_MG-2023]
MNNIDLTEDSLNKAPIADKLSVVEKVGYSLGDLAANLIFQTFVTFIAFFYTDVYKIPAQTATMIIFTGGMIGAFFSPVMGIIADRTQTRWGRYRPWILWTSIPFGTLALLAFTTPDFAPEGKVLYAFITYIALVLVYSANNLPYSALSGVITGNMKQRNSMSAYRFVAVMIAQFIIQVLLLPLVLILGDGDKAVGFENTMMIFSIVGIVFFLITFITTKERVITKVEQKSSIKQDIVDLLKNKPWVIMLILTILVFITLALKGGMYIYYFQNYVDEAHLAQFHQNIGFNNLIAGLNSLLTNAGLAEFQWPKDTAISGNSIFNACGIIFMIIGIGFSKPLADRFGKRDVFGCALFLSTLFVLFFYFYSPESIALMFGSQIFHGFFYGITTPILWAMIADVADYSEWKNNRRATAIVFSAMLFGLKAGLAIGGSLVAGILAYYHYNADLVVQAPDTINGIKTAVSIYAAIPFLLGCGCLFFYEINKKMEQRIEADLKLSRG